MRSFIILLLIIIIALLTVPGSEKFDRYLEKQESATELCAQGKRHYSYRVFSIAYADYCETADARRTQRKMRTEKYLGLFGTFWKLPG